MFLTYITIYGYNAVGELHDGNTITININLAASNFTYKPHGF